MKRTNSTLILLMYVLCLSCAYQEFCYKQQCESNNRRYLFYDVNPPEGFNLRRDVYVRLAVFAHKLQESTEESLNVFKLVLPPWNNIYHWRSLTHKPWSHFFDLNSLRKFAPVIELYEFFQGIENKYTNINLDEVYVLQHFENMFKTGKFEEKMAIESCNKPIETNFYHYRNITSDNIRCLSFHGHTSQLSSILTKSKAKSILIDHAEVALHDGFGDKLYWQARRSMRFNTDLVHTATEFRRKYLNSSDDSDGTKRPTDWRNEKPGRNTNGGPYLSVHLRRRDFVWGRPNEVPTIEDAANQIKQLLVKFNLDKVFIATDAADREVDELTSLLNGFGVHRFLGLKTSFTEGQVAIIDQIICSHAKYFIGTHESTFSFRIQEEREIMGFPVETTFNRLCGKNSECETPSIWKIVY